MIRRHLILAALLAGTACAPVRLTRDEQALRHLRYCATLAGRDDVLCGGNGQPAEGLARWLPAGADRAP